METKSADMYVGRGKFNFFLTVQLFPQLCLCVYVYVCEKNK
jgi:hypothetical protein